MGDTGVGRCTGPIGRHGRRRLAEEVLENQSGILVLPVQVVFLLPLAIAALALLSAPSFIDLEQTRVLQRLRDGLNLALSRGGMQR